MSKAYDVIIIGAGHNGLTAAATIAKRGRKVCVLEKSDRIGGIAANRSFGNGFTVPGMLHDTAGVRPWVVEELGLGRHGIKTRSDDVPVFFPDLATDKKGILLFRDANRSKEEIGAYSAADADSYVGYRKFCDKMTPFIRKVFDEFPPELAASSMPGLWDLFKKALGLRSLGKDDMMELLRIAPMCVADWLNEWFATPLLKAGISAPSIYHSYTGPWSPGTNANMLLAEAMYYRPLEGGASSLVKALEAVCKETGVEIRTGAEVTQIDVSVGRVTGVTLANGEQLQTAKVAAACDPKTAFLKLIKTENLSHQLEQNILHIRNRGTVSKVHIGLKGLPQWKCRPGLKAEYVRIGGEFDYIEKSFDAVKYREISENPSLDIYIPSLEDASLAPEGQHVMSVAYHFAPYVLDGGWTDEAKAKVLERTIATLESYAPGFGALVDSSEVLSPVDIEREYGMDNGHLYHAEHAADQLLIRPSHETARYRTPITGLYLCGAGAHPGGGMTCAPGALSAQAILN